MKIRDAIGQYIAWRQTHGTQFKSGSALLHCFLKGIDREISCDGVTEAQVRSFLGGKGPLTRYRANKYAALAGFYRYAISRGYANCSPLPDNEPKKPPVAPPYIYSHDELRRLFGPPSTSNASRAIRLDAPTFRTQVLLLLYGAGLRSHRSTAAYAGGCRSVGYGPDCAQLEVLPEPACTASGRNSPRRSKTMRLYVHDVPFRRGVLHPFLRTGTERHWRREPSNGAFVGLLRVAGIDGADGKRQSPRLHSLRPYVCHERPR